MLKNQVVIITGGSRGIGAAIARKMASLGADIAVIYHGNKILADVVCTYCHEKYDVCARSYHCDVSNYEETKKVVEQIFKDFGDIHVLINNAGIVRDGLMISMNESDFDDVIQTNLKGAFLMTRHCARIFLRKRRGNIVNISSISGITGNSGQVNYSASKAGIIGLTKTTAKELGSRGILCNAVAPGFIRTDMTESLSDHQKEIESRISLKRMGTPEEVAEAVAFLAQSTYITGAVLPVDGGIMYG